MSTADPFSYAARAGDGVGISCTECQFFKGPRRWPDQVRTSRCILHSVSLSSFLVEPGYWSGEWFCRDFKSKGRSPQVSVREFRALRRSLVPSTMYLAHDHATLGERSFSQLASVACRKDRLVRYLFRITVPVLLIATVALVSYLSL
jgi:hypothetical protein